MAIRWDYIEILTAYDMMQPMGSEIIWKETMMMRKITALRELGGSKSGGFLAVILVSIALLGCSSSVLNSELPKYTGRHIDALVAQMGFPNAEQTIMGRKIYIWNNSESFVDITPITSTSYGYVGTEVVSIRSTSYQTSTSQLTCTIRVFVNKENIVETFGYEGNNGACWEYARRLKR